MSPRKYDMSKRAAAAEKTRRRIIGATMELHSTQGILQTSWEDIARRADVAVGTVYRHYPSLDELVPACGEVALERMALPSEKEIAELFRGAGTRSGRVRRLVTELFAIYERAGHLIRVARRDRDQLEFVQGAHEAIEASLGAVVEAALEPLGVSEGDVRVVRALTDLDVWEALRERDVTGEDAVAAVAEMLDGRLAGSAAAAIGPAAMG